ncbi:hypothetical protein B4U79_16365 [Dinothrombium tinctorium]|uniref:Protein kinase domain-containing protein n=1 Tax=Dinothrombium tinctorium TaxID=1965070 RepID=A0A443RND9_9ACAR|nr:hypothetical protein B4U79_16365 [Dinothrombium tinctorium]
MDSEKNAKSEASEEQKPNEVPTSGTEQSEGAKEISTNAMSEEQKQIEMTMSDVDQSTISALTASSASQGSNAEVITSDAGPSTISALSTSGVNEEKKEEAAINEIKTEQIPTEKAVLEAHEPLDWQKNRLFALSQLHKNEGAREVTEEEVIKEGYSLDGSKIGETYIGTIYRTRNEQKVAEELMAKVIEMASINKIHDQQLRSHGIKILKFLNKNPFVNIVTIFDVFIVFGKLLIIEEFLLTNLDTMLTKIGKVDHKVLKVLGEPLGNAINYLHNIGVAHQNIAPHNIYFNLNDVLKLTSLEYAIVCWDHHRDEVILQRLKEKEIKPGKFVAPEITLSSIYDPMKADVYSYGVSLCYMVLKKYPYDGTKIENFEEQWTAAKYDLNVFLPTIPMDLISKCVQADPEKRITIRDVVIHPFYADRL